MSDAFNAGVEAARAERDDAEVIDAMVAAAAAHLGIERRLDDPNVPAVRRCMEAILARLRADGVVR